MRRSRSYELHRSTLRHHMVYRKALIAQIARSCPICVGRVCVDEDCRVHPSMDRPGTVAVVEDPSMTFAK